jgi:tetratricopeptide (TPR) repeat protein
MRVESPNAAELLEEGEALGASGQLTQAEALFRQARAEYAAGSILLRRQCEALTALGRRSEALGPCMQALESSQSTANFRAMVRALVAGPSPPTMAELEHALAFTMKERDRAAKGNPNPPGAMCDIAESLGDGIMLQHCAEELEQFAPNDPDTQRAEGILASRCPPWRFWGGWLALAAAVSITIGHWLRSLRRSGRRASTAAAMGAAACCALTAFSTLAHADPDNSAESGYLSHWPVDDQAPETKIPSDKDRDADPLEFGYWIQDLALKAELAAAVPDRAVGLTHACSEYEAAGDHKRALNACAAALFRDGLVLADYLHYVNLMLAKPEPLTDLEKKALDNVVVHMREDPEGKNAADDVECAIATRTANVVQLDECTKNLARSAPNDPRTVSYQWSLAMQRGKFDEANVLIDRGSALGLQPEGVANMQRATLAGVKQHRRRVLIGAFAFILLLAGIAVAGWSVVSRRRTVASSPA